jgi:phosphoglycolate phosphatase-like HAD superfamily hydrolase
LNGIINVSLGIENQIGDETVIFFDLDGTLVNTDLANINAYMEAIQIATNTILDIELIPGQRFNRNLLRELMPQLTEALFAEIIAEKETRFKKHLSDTTTNSKVLVLLKTYSQTNKLVLVTNCREKRAFQTLRYHDLDGCFNHMIFRQTNNGNEHVNKYKFAINTLGISPEIIVVIENERCEIEDAISAGIPKKNVFNFEI